MVYCLGYIALIRHEMFRALLVGACFVLAAGVVALLAHSRRQAAAVEGEPALALPA